MPSDRYRIVVNFGNLLELLAAASAVYGVSRLLGLAYGLILLGILLAVGAELIYDATVIRIPLPKRPHPVQAIKRAETRLKRWHWDRHVRRLVREHQ